MEKKYAIEFTFYEDNGNTNKMVLYTDSPKLEGRYIPEKCLKITLFDRNDFNLLRMVDEEINERLQEVQSKFVDPEADSYELYNLISQVMDETMNEKRSALFDEASQVSPLKEVYIGDIFTKNSIRDILGKDSEEYKSIINNQADGVICYNGENGVMLLDYYYKDHDTTIAKLDFDGYLEFYEEDDELF